VHRFCEVANKTFSAEAGIRGIKKFVISDSLSCLLAIHNLQAESGYITKFLKNYTALLNTGKTILLFFTSVLEVMNKRMMWPKWHFILLYLR